MRRTLALLSLTVLAAACSPQSGGEGKADGGAAPAPKGEAPTDAEAQAMLASLPAPYNTADLANGKKQFARCRSCHTLPEGGPDLVGPNLYGVFGRKAGAKDGYNYSDALKKADFVWDGPHLDAWLAEPRTYLPGTKMSFAGLKEAKDRTDLIAYLHTQTGYKPG